MNFSYRAKKIKNPTLHLNDESNNYGTSLSALDSAWDSVAATKKQLTNVDSKIRHAAAAPSDNKKIAFGMQLPPAPGRKSKDNPNIERRVVYEHTQELNHPKENIPPISYPEPISRLNVLSRDLHANSNDFIPFRKDLYGRGKPSTMVSSTAPQHNFNYDPHYYHTMDRVPINSSLAGRSLLKIEQKSNALAKLKEKINQQKMNSSISSNQSNDNLFPQKASHAENDVVKTTEVKDIADEPVTRKVTTAPTAPSYKGFNQAHETFTKPKTTTSVLRKQQRANITTSSKPIERNRERTTAQSSKGSQKKKKGQTQRIVAPKKPIAKISTSSWRAGLEIQRKVKQELKAKKDQEKNMDANDDDDPSEQIRSGKEHLDSMESKTSKATLDVRSPIPEGESEKTSDASILKSTGNKTEDKAEDSDGLDEQILDEPLSSLQDNIPSGEGSTVLDSLQDKGLTETARNVLKEMSNKPIEDASPPRKRVISAVIDTGLKKKMKKNIANKKSPPVKRKLDEDIYPKRKARHYNQEDIQRYMAKQHAERKKQRLDEKKKQEQDKEMQKQKLQELYDKQKAAVKETVDQKKRQEHGCGGTFIKHSSTNSMKTLKEALARMQHAAQVPVIPTASASPRLHESTFREETFFDSLDDIQHVPTNNVITSNMPKTTIRTDAPPSDSPSLSPSHSSNNIQHGTHSHAQPPPPEAFNKSKADRVAAIRATATALRQRLDIEAKRLNGLVQQRHQIPTSPYDSKRWAHPIAIEAPSSTREALGTYPGTDNIDAQASLNSKLTNMDNAAKRIQAMYRGHSVRKSMHWQLPSGRSMYQTLEDARRRAFLKDINNTPIVTLASNNYPSVLQSKFSNSNSDKQYKSTSHKSSKSSRKREKEKDNDSISSNNSHSKLDSSSLSATSLVNEALQSSKALLSDAERSLSSISSRQKTSKLSNQNATEASSFPSYSLEEQRDLKPISSTVDHTERLRDILKKYKNEKGDKYSVINIFARNYPHLRQQQIADQVESRNIPISPNGTDTEEILADAYKLNSKSSVTITPMEEYLTEDSYKNLPTGTENIAQPSSAGPVSSELLILSKNLPSQRTLLSPKTTQSDSEASERLFSPISPRQMTPQAPQTKGNTLKTPDSIVYSFTETDHSESEHSTTAFTSRLQSSASFSDIDQQQLNPILTSTKRSPPASKEEKDASHGTPLSHHEKPSESSVLPNNRMSPNTLERRLHAEINMFDAVGDSLQQVNEMEKVRNIVQAQQETVSLAQVLKSRHLAHQQHLEKLTLEAKERSMKSAQEVEQARQATAEASANALKAISDVKSRASEDIARSAKQLTDVQNQATSTTLEAMNRVEEARQNAANAYKLSVDRQLTDVEKIASAAASAASGTAVELALRHHREQLEELRKKAFAAVSKTYSSASHTETNSSNSSKKKSLHSTSHSELTTSNSNQSKTLMSSYSEQFEKDEIEDKSMSEEVPTVSLSKSTSISEEKTLTKHEEDLSQSKTTPKSSMSTSKEASTSSSRSISTTKDLSVNQDISESLEKDHSEVAEEINTSVHDSIPEEVSQKDDKELSEALFSISDKKSGRVSSVSTHDDSIHSEKFHSSFTEEEFQNDFHMVLPSEKHRRQSLDRKDFVQTVNDSSSDELATPRAVGKWTKKRSKSPFVEEDTFAKFTADMVRQYVQEEEARAKHQAALLGLREKAIIDKTKAEVTYLDMQKKSLKKKGVSDEKMPPINKKQRALMMKLQAEQTEIRRLREVYKQASYDRQSMLNQEKEIQRIRESTQKILNKMETMDQSHTKVDGSLEVTLKSNYESDQSVLEKEDSVASRIGSSEEISEDIPPQQSRVSVEESLISENVSADGHSTSKITKKSNQNQSETEVTSVTLPKEDISVSKDLKKLKYMASKRYLTDREKKLQSNKQQFNEILERKNKLKNWRQKIQDEEEKLKKDIRRVLEKRKDNVENSSQKESDGDKTLTEIISARTSAKVSSRKIVSEKNTKHSEADTSIEEDVSSIAEDYSSGKDSNNSSIAESISKRKTPSLTTRSISKVSKSSNAETVKSSSKESPGSPSQSYGYTNDEFEDVSSKSRKSTSSKQRVEKKRNEEESCTEGTSDASDIEQRLKGLENELQRRRTELQRLRKKKEKETLRRKEQELRKELQTVEQLIHRENKENTAPDTTVSRIQQPRVLSPRNSLDSTVILPEKLKFRSSDRESRRSLDFVDLKKNVVDVSEKENYELKSQKSDTHERTLSEKTDHVISEVKTLKDELSHSDTSSVASEKSNISKSKEATPQLDEISTKQVSSSSTLKHRSSHSRGIKSELDEVQDEASDKSVSSISERAFTDKIRSEKSSIAEELSISASISKSTSVSESIRGAKSQLSKEDQQLGEDIYDNDFFESQTSNRSQSYATKDMNDERTPAKEVISYEDDFEETAVSTKYSSKLSNLDVDVHSSQSSSSTDSNSTGNKKKIKTLSQVSDVLDEASIKSEKSISNEVSSKTSHSYKINASDELKLHTDTAKPTLLSSSSDSKRSSQSLHRSSPEISEHLASVASDLSALTDELEKSRSSNSSSFIVQPDAFSKSNATSAFGFRLNDIVLVEDTMEGTIRFLGKTSFSPVLVAGIELHRPMGTNNGSFQGKQYFLCDQDHGLFTTVDRIKLLDNEKKPSEDKNDSSTVNEVDESLSQHTIDEAVDYEDDFEKSLTRSSSKSAKIISDETKSQKSENLSSVHSISNKSTHASLESNRLSSHQPDQSKPLSEKSLSEHSNSTSSKSEHSRISLKSEHSISLHSDRRLHVVSGESVKSDISESLSFDENEVDENLNLLDDRLSFELRSHSRSSSELSENEIPSPAKLDLTPLADNITDSIMKTLLTETIAFPKQMHNLIESFEKPEAYITPRIEKVDIELIPDISVTNKLPASVNSFDGATDKLLNDAVSHMLKIRKAKEQKIVYSPEKVADKKDDNLLALLSNDEPRFLDLNNDETTLDSEAMLTKKLNQLKDVHDQLGALLGDDDEDDDDDVEEIDKHETNERLIMPPIGFGSEPDLFIPFDEEDTYALVRSAFDNVLQRESSVDISDQVLDELLENESHDNLDEASTKLYQKLIYDVTKALLYDLKDFRDTQFSPRPPWMKIPKKTFSKFTRKTHSLKESELREVIAEHVCTCLDLRSGRASLEKLKRKLPLNLTKKDYVDALLVEELREEEAQWVNYDDDELRVKFQLADAILDNLINETVEILSAI